MSFVGTPPVAPANTAAGYATYGYDLRGNLKCMGARSDLAACSSPTTTYSYDSENRLRGVGATSSFVYDPQGRLFQSTINGTTTRYLYDGPNLIGEYAGASSTPLRRYVFGAAADEVLARYDVSSQTPDAPRWLLVDHQGSIIAETNENGAVTAKLTYDEYGVPGPGNVGLFQYTGQVYLSGPDLYHYKARAYSPTLGRFLQTDPIGYDDGLNWYAYVGNDPLNNADSNGRETKQVNVNVDLLAAQFKYGRYKEVKTNDPITHAYPIAEGRFTSKGAGLPGSIGVSLEYTLCQKCTESDVAGQSPSKTVTLGVITIGVSDNKEKPAITVGFGLGFGFKAVSNDEATLYPTTGKNAGSTIRYDKKTNSTTVVPPPRSSGCLRGEDQGGCTPRESK
ncbi:MAG: RHS repeat-associated core domain-containing protein [Caulobacter sp.]|nr:RHS repeat-associated core domain-containing protein [Caulobacter sp.]